jgi:hypothetical protein
MLGASRSKIAKSSTWSPFHQLPTELWEKIFSFACLDDGSTGRSLSLVSRYVCQTSRPFKYQSLAIRSLLQAESLPRVLTQYSPNRQSVLNLFFLCDPKEMFPDLKQAKPAPSSILRRINSLIFRPEQPRQTKSQFERLIRSRAKREKHISPIILEKLMAVAINRILIVVASTLRTLSISICSPVSFISFVGCPTLPVLQELTIAYGNGRSGSIPGSLLESFEPMPSLRRLNLHRFYPSLDAPDLIRHISRLSPEVEFIMLPWVRAGWKEYWDSTSDLQHLPWPSSLTRTKIYIQPPPPPLLPYLQRSYRTTISECRELAARDERLVFIKPDQEPWEFNGNTLEKEWVSRISGGDGCWGTDNEMALFKRPFG